MKCWKCNRELGNREAVYYWRIPVKAGGWRLVPGWRQVALCRPCLDAQCADRIGPDPEQHWYRSMEELIRKEFRPKRRCEVCKRLVWNYKWRRLGRRIVCGDRCRLKVFNLKRREERLASRKDLRCQSCRTAFTPTRTDAHFCSVACRMRAYRQRASARPSAPPPTQA